jgi:hypothetical protein
VHPRFHYALADGRSVVEFRQMLDGIEHSLSTCFFPFELLIYPASAVWME